MSIAVVCQNGHALRVKDSCAGMKGRCPICGVRFEVPKPDTTGLSDEDILGILSEGGSGGAGAEQEKPSRPSLLEQLKAAVPRVKICEKCEAEIAESSRICPHCHTYVAVWDNR